MTGFRHAVAAGVRYLLAFLAMVLAYVASTMLVGDLGIEMTPEQQGDAARALLIVAALSSTVLSFLIARARWSGIRLVSAVFLIQFGVETFMTQIETIYFNSAVQVGTLQLIGIVKTGAIRALIFAPLAVLIFGHFRPPANPAILDDTRPTGAGLGKWIMAIALLYVLVYFVFGYFVAWQWEETRVYYSGTAEIKPFFVHLGDVFLREDPFLLPFQLLRGLIWGGLTLLIVSMIHADRWAVSASVGLVFAVLMAVPLTLFPNPYMPPMVIQAHSVEVGSSMLLFGAVAGWLLHRHRRVTS